MTTPASPLPRVADATLSLLGPLAPAREVLVLRGDLDIATAPSLRAVLEPAVSGADPVVSVDASSVAFVDSSGLEPLAEAAEQLGMRGARLQLVGASPAVRRVATILGMHGRLGLDSGGPIPGPACA